LQAVGSGVAIPANFSKNVRPSFESNRQEKIMKKLSMRPTGHALDVEV
jgi:hypothetical protein